LERRSRRSFFDGAGSDRGDGRDETKSARGIFSREDLLRLGAKMAKMKTESRM
jgi:hypothetical protein